MESFKKKLISIRVLTCFAMMFPLFSTAKNHTHHFIITDSLVPTNNISRIKAAEEISADESSLDSLFAPSEEEFSSELTSIENDYNKTSDSRKTFLRLLRAMKMKKLLNDRRNKTRLLNDLAKSSIRLKLYPQAMLCYYNLQISTENPASLSNSSIKPKTSDNETDQIFEIVDTSKIKNGSSNPESEPVSVSDILESFDDRKDADAYALIIHVKQPSSGNRKAFTGIDNVGHMFITLIKYNNDKSITERSFGFYPDKTNTFSATPLNPTARPVFKDDGLHAWDEAVGKFISKKRFEKILRLLTKYKQKKYHLNENNCTDFGLSVAGIGGVIIAETAGKWPLGKGNNPASAGTSILEGKIVNADSYANNKNGLFICVAKSLEK